MTQQGPGFTKLFTIVDTNWTARASIFPTTNYTWCGGNPTIGTGANQQAGYVTNQSPIDIDTNNVVAADFSDLTFSLGYKIAQKGTLENDGRTGQVLYVTYFLVHVCGILNIQGISIRPFPSLVNFVPAVA